MEAQTNLGSAFTLPSSPSALLKTTMAAAAAISKAVLISVFKFSTAVDVPTLDYSGTDGYDFEKAFLSDPVPDPDFRLNPNPFRMDKGSSWVERAWFMIEAADSGTFKLSRVFMDSMSSKLPTPPHPLSSYCMIGSSLYESSIGAKNIRCLDLKNQSDGWKVCSHFDLGFADINFGFNQNRENGYRVVAYNQFLYCFYPLPRYRPTHLAYVYDTSKQQDGYFLTAPPDPPGRRYGAIVWLPLEGKGMLVCFGFSKEDFYLHDPYGNKWKACENYEPLPQCICGPAVLRSVLNGILYLRARACIFAYDCNQGKLLYSVKLPELCINDVINDSMDLTLFPQHLVAISQSRFCLIGNELNYLYCACVEVCSESDLPAADYSAKLVGVRCFQNDCIYRVSTCVPVDLSVAQIAKPFVPLQNTREEHKPSKEKLRVELSGNGKKTGSRKAMNPLSTLPIFPFSKRMMYQPLMKKVKREQSLMVVQKKKENLSAKQLEGLTAARHKMRTSNSLRTKAGLNRNLRD